MKRWNTLLAALLAALLLLPSGCTGQSGGTAAMGRYVEAERPLPGTALFEVLGFRVCDDGALELLAYTAKDTSGQVYLTLSRSEDGGGSWTDITPGALTALDDKDSDVIVSCAAWDKNGSLWLCYSHQEAELPAECLLRLDGDGTSTELPWSIPAVEEDGSSVRSFQIADNGDFLFERWFSLIQVDGESGELLRTLSSDTSPMAGYTVSGSSAVVSTGSDLVWYDLESGQETARVTCPTTVSLENGSDRLRLLSTNGEDGLFFADAGGICRAQPENSAVEQLADGSLLTLSSPSLMLISMAVHEQQFYVLGYRSSSGSYVLFSYVYDPDVPTIPAQELSVWSLSESPDILQTIEVFQKNHPDVQVNYQVGIPEESGITRDDALRTLNTQLTAGKGPDVLMLDDVSLEAYAEKGVLADLGSLLDSLTGDGTVLPNQAGAYCREDGSCPAISARFLVPMMQGSEACLAACGSLTELAGWLSDNQSSYAHPLCYTNPATLLRFFFPLFYEQLFSSDGTADLHALSQFLSDLKQIRDLDSAVPSYDDGSSDFDFIFGSLNWMVGAAGINIGSLTAYSDFYPTYQASADAENGGTIDLLFHNNVFLPSTVLGINARSTRQTLAEEFLRTALSEEVQGNSFGTGLPVNTAALDASAQQDPARFDDSFGMYGTTLTDAEGASVPVELYVYYPPEDVRQEMLQRLKALDTPCRWDSAVLQLLLDNTGDYFSGEASLDETLQVLSEKLALYQAE